MSDDLHVFCRLYGVQHRLKITAYNMVQRPHILTVDSSDFLKMMPHVIVGAAYDTFTPYKILKAGRADFKIKKIERSDAYVWRYTFEDYRGQLFETYLIRRIYDYNRYSKSVRAKRQSTQIM